MKFVLAPIAAVAAALASGAAIAPLMAQTPAPQAPGSSQSGEPSQQHAGQVIFSRSTDEEGRTATVRGPAAPPAASAPVANNAERQAVTFTRYDLDAHLEPASQHIAVRALLAVRNDGHAPLAHIPLQISSSLDWERIRIGARDVSFQEATLNSDADHTGQLHEAAVPLVAPLAPGATLELDVTYSGTIAPNAQRLVALGAPQEVAAHSDWDAIGVEFTGLRGFGNVVWYPVSSVPAILGISQAAAALAWQKAGAADVDSARLFDEIGEQKLRMEAAHFRLRLTEEFPPGQAPTVALLNGRSVPLAITKGGGEVPGVATAELDDSTLGFEAPSLFVAIRKPVAADHVTLWALSADEAAAHDWLSAAAAVTPFLAGWLGPQPRSNLAVLDLPDPADVPAEAGALVLSPIREAADDELDRIVVHGLARAWIQAAQPPPAWLDQGLAYFMSTVWLEKQSGRTRALESLEADRAALALAEPSSPGESAGQPLRQAISPVYYRTKAAYVFWMLRDLAGDAALSAALRAYDPARDPSRNAAPGEFEALLERNSHRDLSWFFADWVDADKGLPDLTIDSVFPAAAQNGNTLVAVNLSNAGYASAEIPVTVRSADASITRRVLVPSRGKVVQRILMQEAPTEVQANDGTVPETEASVHVTRLTDAGLSSGGAAPPR
ncbi:MAG TPA: hypothetical protein VGG26_11755 [Terracidiphilus sp.]|jgi:hypothetical protein